MDGITALFTNLRDQLITLAPIVAVLGIALWFIMNSLAPVMPDWAQAAKGHVQRTLVGIIIVGGATTLVTQLQGLIR